MEASDNNLRMLIIHYNWQIWKQNLDMFPLTPTILKQLKNVVFGLGRRILIILKNSNIKKLELKELKL